jgi:hypothetical protein
VYGVKSVPQPDTIALLGINYCFQIIETGFAEWFYASHRMGPAQILLKISAIIAERETYVSNDITLNPPLFSLVNTFKVLRPADDPHDTEHGGEFLPSSQP